MGIFFNYLNEHKSDWIEVVLLRIGALFEASLPMLASQRVLPPYFPDGFRVSCLHLWFLIHLELSFVQVRKKTLVSFIYIRHTLFSAILVEDAIFYPMIFFFSFLFYIFIKNWVCGLISGPCSILFHQCTCLFLCHYDDILFNAMDLYIIKYRDSFHSIPFAQSCFGSLGSFMLLYKV